MGKRNRTWGSLSESLGKFGLVAIGSVLGVVAYHSWTKNSQNNVTGTQSDNAKHGASQSRNARQEKKSLRRKDATIDCHDDDEDTSLEPLVWENANHQVPSALDPSDVVADSHGGLDDASTTGSREEFNVSEEFPQPPSPINRSYSTPTSGQRQQQITHSSDRAKRQQYARDPFPKHSSSMSDRTSDGLSDYSEEFIDDSVTTASSPIAPENYGLSQQQQSNNLRSKKEAYGHVFIVYGDLTTFECDAWAIPTRSITSQRSDKTILRGTAGPSNKWLHSRLIDEYDLTLNRAIDDDGICRVAQVVGLPEGKFSSPFLVSVSPTVSENSKSARAFLRTSEQLLKTGSVYHSSSGELRQVIRRKRRPRNRRSRYLVALPVLGTGAGGARQNAGLVIHQMLDVLHSHVAVEGGIDVALVTNERETYTAAQAARMSFLQRRGGSAQLAAFPLSPYLRRECGKLAALAKQGKLALFIGAGMSVSSGLPLWEGLLDELAIKAGLTEDQWGVAGEDSDGHIRTGEGPQQQQATSNDESFVKDDEDSRSDGSRNRVRSNSRSSVQTGTTSVARDRLASFHQLGFLDRARVIEQNLSSQGIHLGEAVSKVFKAARGPALGTCLLASLPVELSVTTNYDNLFEDAWSADRQPVNVLPHEPRKGTSRTLLKMHGCVKKPREIVLTRGDYLGYAETKAALGALVQSVLLTKHMLFVGFSLGDDNFNRLFYAVQKASEKQANESGNTLGTVLAVTVNPLQVQLWENHMHYVSMEEEAARSGRIPVPQHDINVPGSPQVQQQFPGNSVMDPESFAELCRMHDIFLDYLAFKSSDVSPHLLTPRFTALLTREERLLSGAIMRFLRDLPEEAKRTVAWRKMKQLLLGLGLNPSELHSFHHQVGERFGQPKQAIGAIAGRLQK